MILRLGATFFARPTLRFSNGVHMRLKHVALNRKAKRVEPWKMKELVEAALVEWLERNEK